MRGKLIGAVGVAWIAWVATPAPVLAHHHREMACEVYEYVDERGVFTRTVVPESIPASKRQSVRIRRACAEAHAVSHAGGTLTPSAGCDPIAGCPAGCLSHLHAFQIVLLIGAGGFLGAALLAGWMGWLRRTTEARLRRPYRILAVGILALALACFGVVLASSCLA